jgi:hypothetical protein
LDLEETKQTEELLYPLIEEGSVLSQDINVYLTPIKQILSSTKDQKEI